MGDLTFYDAAYPPAHVPSGMDGVAFYIGGDTPHVWTLAEIEAQPVRFRLPIYVRSNPIQANVALDAIEAVARLQAIGAPKGCLVALDSETSADPNYVAQFYYDIKNAGYVLMDYGSTSSLFGNNIPDGYYWGAHWTDLAGVESGQQMTQWKSLGAYDESTARSALPFWDTGAKTAPVPVPAPLTQPITVTLPLVKLGMRQEVVRTVQVLCGRRGLFPANSGTPESPDGIFGIQTLDAIQNIQHAAHVPVTGEVDAATWPVLTNG
jgi:peptidoglycan hydrolase-like protein with peptidoglycan-binding domain